MELPLVPLRTFHLVVRHRSLTAAARHLGVTQPAVTQQIRRLEGALGLRLFRRDGRRIVPTEAGETLAAFTQRIFQLVDAARDALEGVVELRVGHLRLGASRTAGAYYIGELLGRFKRRYPGVRVSLSVGNSQTILAGVLDFTLHAGLVAGRPAEAQLVALPLVRDRLLVALPPGHPLARQASLTIRDLQGYPLILREPGSTTRRLIEEAGLAQGVTLEPTMELESNEAIKRAVMDGVGVAVLAQAAIRQDVAGGRLVARRLRERPSLEFALVYHRDRVLSPVLAAFLALAPVRRRQEMRPEAGRQPHNSGRWSAS